MARPRKENTKAAKPVEVVEEVKVAPVEVVATEVEAVVAEVETPVVEEKKAVAKKSTKKAASKKADAEVAEKKTTTKKAAAKKVTETVYVQYAGNEYDVADIVEKAKAAYEGKKAIKEVKVYVKPEEGMAYYVINEDETGSVAL